MMMIMIMLALVSGIGGGVELPTGSDLLLSNCGLANFGGGAVPYVWMLLLISLLFTLSSLYDRCHLIAFASWRYHLRTMVCIGGSWPRRLYGAGVRWEHVGAPGRIILVNLLRGADLTILAVEVVSP